MRRVLQLLLQTTRRYHCHRRHLHNTTRRAQSALRCPALAPRPMLLLLRRMGTRLRLRLTPPLRPLCSHRDLGVRTLLYLPSMVVVVVALAVVYRLIILLRAHSRNLRHNNIEHREIVGSSLTFFLRWTAFLFYVCVLFSFFLFYMRIMIRAC
jgi:hypothetical protein